LILALEKYSTSKIQSIEDLYKVMTFGFRGEALASIASVSEFSISSKTADCKNAKQVISEGGENISEQIIAHEIGTSVKVSKLFFNTPARLAYLKKPRTEYLKIQEFIQKIALIYPNV
jgi:DNA mismatch repair protein MutL